MKTSSTLVLQSNEFVNFEVDVRAAKTSLLIKNMLEDLGVEDDDKEPIPLPNVNTKILTKVIEWATNHIDETYVEEEHPGNPRELTIWETSFLNVDQHTLFELMLAANYLDMGSLLNASCQTVANMIKGKTPEQIREIYNIPNDFTPEEEEQIRMENAWCEEK